MRGETIDLRRELKERDIYHVVDVLVSYRRADTRRLVLDSQDFHRFYEPTLSSDTMTALSLVYQPLRLGVVLRFILGKLFNISSGIHGLSSVGQNPPSNEELTIVDSRTNRQYHIPIANNAVQAVDIGKIFIGNEFDYSGRVSNALKVLDPGLSNTAVMTSNVTFVYVSAFPA